jgi:hypothetical protein
MSIFIEGSPAPSSGGLQLQTTGPLVTGPFTLVFTPKTAIVTYFIADSFEVASVGYKWTRTDNGVTANVPSNGAQPPGGVNSTNGTEPESHAFFWTETTLTPNIVHTVTLNLLSKYGNPTNGMVEFMVMYL